MLHKRHLHSEIKRFLLRWLTAHKYLSSAKILYNYRQNMSIYKLFTGTSSGCAFLLLLMFQRVDRCLLYSTKADSGDHIGSPLRMSVSKYGFPSAPTKRQRSAFCGKEETPAPKAKVFHRKTEQLHRAPTMSAAIGIMFFHSVHSRIGSRLSLAHWMKHHVSGRPHRVAPTSDYGTFANYKYMSSVTDIVGQGSHSVRTCLILPGFRRGDPAWSPVNGNISFQCRPRHHVSLDKLKENRYNKSR